MAGTTPKGYPYAEPADPLVQWPATSKALADKLEAAVPRVQAGSADVACVAEPNNSKGIVGAIPVPGLPAPGTIRIPMVSLSRAFETWAVANGYPPMLITAEMSPNQGQIEVRVRRTDDSIWAAGGLTMTVFWHVVETAAT